LPATVVNDPFLSHFVFNLRFSFVVCRLIRGDQSYVFDFLLTNELLPAPIVYGTFCPIIGYYCIKQFIIEPYQIAEKRKKQAQSEQENSEKLIERKRQAQSSIDLMKATYERSVEREKKVNGLVIIRAIYGNQDNLQTFMAINENNTNLDDKQLLLEELTEVTIPLQCLVRESTLVLPEASKVCTLLLLFLDFFDKVSGLLMFCVLKRFNTFCRAICQAFSTLHWAKTSNCTFIIHSTAAYTRNFI
jgi:hypothetical protein